MSLKKYIQVRVDSGNVQRLRGELKCPRCGKEELSRKDGIVNGKRVVTVIFKCFFSATFEEGLTDKEMQKRLDEFEKSGKM